MTTAVYKRLGELVLRTSKKDEMTTFYQEVIGLETYATIGAANFLKISDDLEGHPQLLAIFEKEWEYSGPKPFDASEASAGCGTLHHFAFAMKLEDFKREQTRLKALGQNFETATHSMLGWHSLYMHDPDGNSVEFVCYDPSLLDVDANREILA